MLALPVAGVFWLAGACWPPSLPAAIAAPPLANNAARLRKARFLSWNAPVVDPIIRNVLKARRDAARINKFEVATE